MGVVRSASLGINRESRESTDQPLYFLNAGGTAHYGNRLALLWIGFYASMSEHKAYKLPSFYSKCTFVGIEVYLIAV